MHMNKTTQKHLKYLQLEFIEMWNKCPLYKLPYIAYYIFRFNFMLFLSDFVVFECVLFLVPS
jgi:hypothetical protein